MYGIDWEVGLGFGIQRLSLSLSVCLSLSLFLSLSRSHSLSFIHSLHRENGSTCMGCAAKCVFLIPFFFFTLRRGALAGFVAQRACSAPSPPGLLPSSARVCVCVCVCLCVRDFS